jgi:hypothetical protein
MNYGGTTAAGATGVGAAYLGLSIGWWFMAAVLTVFLASALWQLVRPEHGARP